MIFQHPISALNPVFRIGAQMLESMTLHLPERRRTLWTRALDEEAALRLLVSTHGVACHLARHEEP